MVVKHTVRPRAILELKYCSCPYTLGLLERFGEEDIEKEGMGAKEMN